jgi:serine/threonine-protein kinase
MDDGGRKPHLRTLDRSEDSAETAAQWPVRIGDVVDDKYRIERQLGSGGMGIVVAARHLKLGELVALKFLRLEHAGDSHLGERLKREAQATFRLRSEHSVRAMDVGQLPSGSVYIVMELLEGEDLRSILSARGTLPEKDAVSYALQVCDALEDAHALGIIHRDLKPQNLFLARQPRGTSILKVLDFGVSKLDPARFDAAPMTDPEGAVGTPRYMAPEQWGSGTQVDARTDVWALGMILYEMLTGSVPNGRRSAAERQALLMAGAIQSLRALRPEVTPGIEHVVLRCLRADPDRRWRSARRLAVALREARPDVELAPAGLPVTRSDVTAFDPQAHRSEALAQAFGGRSARPSSARPGAPSQVVTRRAASPSMPGYGRLPDPPAADPDEATEVSVPRFTASDHPPTTSRLVGTLRSFEAVPEPVAPVLPSAPPPPAPADPRPLISASSYPPHLVTTPSVPPLSHASQTTPRPRLSAGLVGLLAVAVVGTVAVAVAVAVAVWRSLAAR